MRKIIAVILESAGSLKIVEKEILPCGPGEVLIRVEACGICRTDVKCVKSGQKDLTLPRVLGHELAGTVFKTGDEVKGVKAGDRVQVSPGIACGKCAYCQSGADNLCTDIKIIGFNYDGGFQEYILIPEEGVKNGILNSIPEGISFSEAAMVEPLACCINMQESLDLRESDTLVIFGTGRLGLLNLKLAKANGIKNVIGIENNKSRFAMAKRFGFDHLINSAECDASEKIKDITESKGADAVINCCPSAEVMDQGLEILAKRGRFGFFSGLAMQENLQLQINKIHYKELKVIGAYGCSLQNNIRALKYLGERKVEVKDLITSVIGLEDITAGLELMDSAKEELTIIIERESN